jgi:hypothetical protein
VLPTSAAREGEISELNMGECLRMNKNKSNKKWRTERRDKHKYDRKRQIG